jgi:methionyl-tRNA formyltransferase
MKNEKNKILFLGENTSTLFYWLKSIEGSVMQTSERITTEVIHSNNINFIVSFGYRHILSKHILDLFPNRAINLYLSYLPFNRGADPNLWSFVENTPKGVTIHYLDAGIDTGDIIVQQELKFDSNYDTLASSYEQLQVTIVDLFKENWREIKASRCKRKKQNGEGTFHKIGDKKKLDDLLEDGWDTKIFLLEGQVPDK